jgi:ubiquinone/menaquinone biosynthesis C-methylase UbiE
MTSSTTTVDSTQALLQKKRKAYKGVAMEGFIARWYSKTGQKRIEEYKYYAKLVCENAPANSDVLEVAPGPGYLSIELAKLGKYKITGLDISQTFVEIALGNARKAGAQVEFRHGDAAQMPFSDDTFDFVICTAAFKNFPDPVRVLDEMFRVLRPGGKALIIDLRRDAPVSEINEYVNQLNLSWINSFMTKVTFKYMLLKSAYSEMQIHDFAAKSSFRRCEIVDDGIGFDIWMEKPAQNPKLMVAS